MILVSNLSRVYGSFQAVSDVSFTVNKGEVVGLLGQNGAGKTTIMDILAGILAPTAGTARIASHPAQSIPAKRILGYLPETPPVYPEMNVQEYLRFCCQIKQVMNKDIPMHVQDILSLCGLNEVEHKLIGSLSKGFRQRVGLAQALCGDPEILLLDEPTAGFDPLQAVAFRKLIKKLSKDKAILFSSHLLPEVEAICDRVLILHKGRLVVEHATNLDVKDAQSFEITLASSDARLLSSLRQLPAVSRVKSLKTNQEDVSRFMVETTAGTAFSKELFSLTTSLHTPILSLIPQEETLESLFLHASGNAKEDGT